MQRVTYRRRLSYNTKSNKTRVIKTPGGNLRNLHIKKRVGKVKCGDCGNALAGIPQVRPHVFQRMSKCQKNVTRAYGGSRCHSCVRNRVVRAFLVEEQKIVKKLIKSQEAAKGKK